MRLVRFKSDKGVFWGEFQPDGIAPLIGNPFGTFRLDTMLHQHGAVRLLAPALPSKIICVGLNYHAHIEESKTASEAPKEPFIFFKPPSAIVGPGATIELPASSKRVDFEGELALVIGKRGKNIPQIEAADYILGLTCANDVTARDFQQSDKQWTRAKGFDTFCPLGPWVCTDASYDNIEIESYLNLSLRQRALSSEMIFTPEELISYISSIMTLEAGDVILTGAPAGVGQLHADDQVEVRIQGIGALVNTVADGGAV